MKTKTYDEGETEFRWYILYVMITKEHKVKRKIEDIQKKEPDFSELIKEVLVPISTSIVFTNNKKKEKIECIFSGYIFFHAKLTMELYYKIMSIYDIIKFLGKTEDQQFSLPCYMNDDEINRVFNSIDFYKEKSSYAPDFVKGDYVRITFGVFRNYKGRIKSVHNGKVSIQSDFMNAADIKDIPIFAIEKIGINDDKI